MPAPPGARRDVTALSKLLPNQTCAGRSPLAPWKPQQGATSACICAFAHHRWGGDVRQLIIRMARENPSWGYFRLRGELLKLGYPVAATSIRSALLAARIPPAPQRSGMSWKQFLRAHAESVIAADFFSVDTIFFKRLYILFFVHMSTRRILAARCTSEPNEAWVLNRLGN
jgi:hypothetical protein